MAHSYTQCLYHVVFSTKERQPFITPKIQGRLWPYLGGIAKANKFHALAVGGIADHLHLLLSLPATLPVAKAVQLVKGGSSKWVHQAFPEQRLFAWQEGYGAFSVSASVVPATLAYIRNQEQHHRRRSFQDEFRAILVKHGITWDERYVWG